MSKEYFKRKQDIRLAARKRKKRTFTVIILILVLFVFVCGFFIRGTEDVEKKYITYTVRCGDTLWNIARDLYGNNCDIRYKIDYIERENGIMDSRIYPGMVLMLEVE